MSKTAQQIFEMASALIYEGVEDDAESKAFSVAFLNIHLQKCLNIENSIRRYNGETELTEAPYLTALTETVNYDDSLTRDALPYALASHFYAEAMNAARAAEMNAQYETAKMRATKYTAESIVDAYAPEE